MNKEFIPYQEDLALKELGFDEPCLIKDTEQGEDCVVYYVHSNGRPTFSQAFRWFREKHKLHSHISLGISDEQDRSGLEYDEYIYVIEGLSELEYDNYGESSFYKTPEEAELACLKKLIEIVKQK